MNKKTYLAAGMAAAAIAITAMARLQGSKPVSALDAGPIYQQIADQVKSSPLSKEDAVVANGLPPSHMPSPEQFARIHAALKHQANLIALIHMAASRPQCDLGIDPKDPNSPDTMPPRFATIRMAARALTMESLDLAHQGRMREAVQNQALGFRLADQSYIGKSRDITLMASAVDAVTLEGMRKLLYLSDGDPVIAQDVADSIHKNLHTPRISALVEVRAAIMTTSARLLIEKSKNSQFPVTLNALPDAPLDPYSGRPLKYRREGRGFVLYSVGKDGSFDGGSPNEKPKPGQDLFRYPMPAYFNEPANEFW